MDIYICIRKKKQHRALTNQKTTKEMIEEVSKIVEEATKKIVGFSIALVEEFTSLALNAVDVSLGGSSFKDFFWSERGREKMFTNCVSSRNDSFGSQQALDLISSADRANGQVVIGAFFVPMMILYVSPFPHHDDFIRGIYV